MPNKVDRCCFSCGVQITECMGFCKAGDVLAVRDGKQSFIRELCGSCAAGFHWTEEGTLEEK